MGAWRSGEEHATWTSRAEAIVALGAQEHIESLHHDRLRLRNESNNSPRLTKQSAEMNETIRRDARLRHPAHVVEAHHRVRWRHVRLVLLLAPT